MRIKVSFVIASVIAGMWVACSFPSVTYRTDASTPDATVDADVDADAEVDAYEEPPPPDFPDADPDVLNPCDQDKDGYKAIGCDGGKDCNDFDKRAHPGQDFLTDVPNGPPNGDWNCAGGVEPQYGTVSCGLTNCNAQGFLADPGCGKTATFVICNGVLCAAVDAGTRTQGCR